MSGPLVPGPAAAARAEAGRVLGLVQGWLGAGELADARLGVVTAGGGAGGRGGGGGGPGGGGADRAGGGVWGLVRSTQSENPGRLVLGDLPAAAGSGAGAAGG